MDARTALAPCYVHIAARYLGREQLFLETPPETTRDEPSAAAPTAGLTPDKLAAIVGWLATAGRS